MSIDHLLNVTVEVWRLTETSDGQGGWTQSYTFHHNERFRISSPSYSERLIAAQSGADLGYIGYCKADADVQRTDQLRGTEISRYNPPLEVFAKLPPSIPHHMKVQLSTEQPGAPG